MKPAPFGYALAENRQHAIELLRQEGAEARPLAGGQSLVPMMNFRLARPSFLVDLNGCADLNYVRREADKLHLGAMVRQRDAEMHPLVRQFCPLVSKALSGAGPMPIRNRGTIGGSLANGYPLADLIAVSLALEGTVVISNSVGDRLVPAEGFFVDGMETSIEAGELLTEVVLPISSANQRYFYQRRGNHRGGEALAIVCAVAEVDGSGDLSWLRIVGAGLGGKPLRLRNVERAATDQSSRALISDAYRADLNSREFVESGDEMEFAEDQVEVLVRSAVEELRATRSSPGHTRER